MLRGRKEKKGNPLNSKASVDIRGMCAYFCALQTE